MKIKDKRFAIFGLVVAVTACSDTITPQSQVRDSGFSNDTFPDSGHDGDASVDGAASVPLIIPPEAPLLQFCTSPYAPVLEAVPVGATLPVFANLNDVLSLGVDAADAGADAAAPTSWTVTRSVALPDSPANIEVYAQLSASDCPNAVEFTHNYSVRASFAPAAGVAGSTAVSKDDSRIQAWATRVLGITYGANVTTEWQTPENALGPASDSTTKVVSLGEGGVITLGFDVVLSDGPGYDLAVYENGFADDFLEVAFVEVSSDGTQFIRFDTSSLVDSPVSAYGTLDPTKLEGLAGKYRVGYGTPYDLSWLKDRPEVRAGVVDLSHIVAVRIVDIAGDGRVRDSFGHIVYDPYPTSGSAGFDLEGISLLNVAP